MANRKSYRAYATVIFQSGEEEQIGEVFSGMASGDQQAKRQMWRRTKNTYPGRTIVDIKFTAFRIYQDETRSIPQVDPSRIQSKPNRQLRIQAPTTA